MDREEDFSAIGEPGIDFWVGDSDIDEGMIQIEGEMIDFSDSDTAMDDDVTFTRDIAD